MILPALQDYQISQDRRRVGGDASDRGPWRGRFIRHALAGIEKDAPFLAASCRSPPNEYSRSYACLPATDQVAATEARVGWPKQLALASLSQPHLETAGLEPHVRSFRLGDDSFLAKESWALYLKREEGK